VFEYGVVRGGCGVVVELEFCFLYYDRWWVQVRFPYIPYIE
jgi:hypothetical protein